jgi:ABC-type transporter Mla subunit MlaD
MQKTSKLIEAARAWREKNAEKGLNLKSLDDALAALETARGQRTELKEKLAAASEKVDTLAKSLQATLAGLKDQRKQAAAAAKKAPAAAQPDAKKAEAKNTAAPKPPRK